MEENKQQPEISEVTKVTSEEVIQEALKPRPVYGQAYDMINKEGKQLSRRFLGNIFGRGAEKKEFEAYLKGKATYNFKKQANMAVRQEYFYI